MPTLKFNANQLKLIAIVAMTIDHLAWLIFPGLVKEPLPVFLHLIGRLTAPIMWYFIAEGCFYTKDITKYFWRLFGFALVSHFAFCFGLGVPFNVMTGSLFNKTSVLFPLAMSVLLIAIFKNARVGNGLKIASIIFFCVLTFTADWSNIALMMPFFLYQHRGDKKKQVQDYLIWISVYAMVYTLFIDRLYGLLQFGTLLSLPLLMAYDGNKGSSHLSKWFFYLYFPAHLFVIGILRIWLYGDVPLVF
ncbi:TraX family protein [Streptococcus entericus]|uniref:TraX family protein n=1 Tax=Streptococcus entericus TaxID=155680 RepID=UPI0003677230|nr:TraX family protein [Streptococcus entericus]